MEPDRTHSRIKMFSGPLSQDGNLAASLRSEVMAFASSGNVCARSLGVEFVEARNLALVSLGYTEEPGPPVRLNCVKTSQLFPGEKVDVDRLGAEMSEAAAAHGGILCHEFYVTSDGSVFAVFLSAHGG